VAIFPAQPVGLTQCLRPAAFSLAYVDKLHCSRSALPGHKQGDSSGGDEKSKGPINRVNYGKQYTGSANRNAPVGRWIYGLNNCD